PEHPYADHNGALVGRQTCGGFAAGSGGVPAATPRWAATARHACDRRRRKLQPGLGMLEAECVVPVVLGEDEEDVAAARGLRGGGPRHEAGGGGPEKVPGESGRHIVVDC